MDATSVAYVLCRIEDDSSLAPISEHEDIPAAVAAAKHQVEVEDFGYGLYADSIRVACFAEGRIGYREWGLHCWVDTPLKNPRPIPQTEAYIASP